MSVLHYAVNRPPGAQWGESDLAPVLKWLSRYGNWLEDRARLNRFRNSFAYVVRGAFGSEEDRAARQAALAANPPTSGSILVIDENESWSVISPQLESADASTDGLALKKMIASGVGLPLHFLAEPEIRHPHHGRGGRRPDLPPLRAAPAPVPVAAGGRAAGGAAAPGAGGSGSGRGGAAGTARGRLSSKDNATMAAALGQVMDALTGLRDRQLIDDAELLRLAYRFAGEVVDVEAMLRRARPEAKP